MVSIPEIGGSSQACRAGEHPQIFARVDPTGNAISDLSGRLGWIGFGGLMVV